MVAVVSGTVEGSAELYVLETRVPCVYYEAVYESYRSRARGRRPLWVPDRFSNKCAGLVIRDGSGEIRIAGNADTLVVRGGHRHSERLGRGGRRRVVAHFIRTGDRVKVLGMVSPPPPGAPADAGGQGRWLAAAPGGRIEIAVLR